jgi:hypothetical protein
MDNIPLGATIAADVVGSKNGRPYTRYADVSRA